MLVVIKWKPSHWYVPLHLSIKSRYQIAYHDPITGVTELTEFKDNLHTCTLYLKHEV
jgi:hypothetical protein